MAEEALGKTVIQLKRARTNAKANFTKQANFLGKEAENMVESELKEEFKKLSTDVRGVIEANDDYMAGVLAEMEAKADDDPVILNEQQKADLERTVKDCELRFDEIKLIVQTNLWKRYGQVELSSAIREAEKACDHVASIPVDSIYCEGYEMQLTFLEKLVKEATRALSTWEKWIPVADKGDLEGRVNELKVARNRFEMRKVEFVKARRVAEDAWAVGVAGARAQMAPIVKIKPTSLPRFSGSRRDFHRWRKDWESLQRQGEPTGSAEVKKFQLLDSIDGKIGKDLGLPAYNTAEDMFRVLENRYGNRAAIAMEIVEELEKLPAVKGNQPRKVIDLIQTVEKALVDLTDLESIGAIKNPLVIKSIESKLPDFVKRDWLVFMVDPANGVTANNHFDALLVFLKKQEDILERLEQLRVTDKFDKPDRRFEKVYASTKTTKKDASEGGCIVCGDERHKDKIFFCRKFKGLALSDKKIAIKKLGACRKCLGCHEDNNRCRDVYLCKNKNCLKEGFSDHHFFLCPKTEPRRANGKVEKDGKRPNKLTEEQEEFLAELSPDLAQRCRKAFTNKALMINEAGKAEQGLVERYGLQELPVIMMLMEVTANAGQKIGTLVDLASDTNYITHEAASRLSLRSENVTLVVHGVSGMTVKVKTKRYLLRVRVRTSKGTERAHELVCYGLDKIAEVHQVIKPEQLMKFFPEVAVGELKRPEQIELLISHREGRLAPQRVKVVGDLVLWESPLGKTVGGAHPDLFEEVRVAAHESKTHFARSMRTAAVKYEEIIESPEIPTENKKNGLQGRTMAKIRRTAASNREFLEWWKWDSIGAACEPKCGGCRCGNCPPGGKEMTLAEERELEVIKEGLSYRTKDAHCKAPHWVARYPWIENPASLPNNRNGVEATFLRTERQLKREPEWWTAYKAQIHEMVARGAAVRLTEETIKGWKGPVWYVSHLVAPNPHSVTTPVRLVWNSSQKFKGLSMNDLLLKGPDVLNPIRSVLLRFRKGEYAALGDIKKMYNSVWLEEREVHLHRFLWRDTEGEEIGEYAITRVNIGDRPAGCIAQLAMRETARLEEFAHLKEEKRVLEEDSYVDDILTSHNDLQRLDKITKGVEKILEAGGFSLKPWVRSGQSGRQDKAAVNSGGSAEEKALILPNQMKDDDNKALGIGYLVEEDQLYVKTSINFSKRKRKMRMDQNLNEDEVRPETPNPLTRRALLSQVAGLYDPIGLVTPAKQKGAILVRRAFQETGGGSLTRETWDKALSTSLREEAIKLFEEYVRLGQIRFHRSLTPTAWRKRPWGITFSDGSDRSYGAVMFLRWSTDFGVEVRLVESKAKLTPLDQKGEAVKAEVCGAVFASRLRKYVEKHCRLEIERWFHFVDSQTVLGAIQRDSYGYQTFFANRIGEIQKAGPVEDWWWIPGDLNVADIITRGATPEDLDGNSAWQNGPEFLRLPAEQWPKKSAKEVAIDARESVNKLQRKAFSVVITRAQIKKNLEGALNESVGVEVTKTGSAIDPTYPTSELGTSGNEKGVRQGEVFLRRKPAGSVIKNLLDVRKYGSLFKLVRIIAWVWRATKNWLRIKVQTARQAKWEAKNMEEPAKGTVLTVREREDALRDLFLAAQEDVAFPDTTLSRLVVYKDRDSGLLLCGGRVQIFNEERTAVPILPREAWISTLVALEAHKVNHEEVAGTLLRMREKAWVIKGRRLAKKTVDSCVVCRKSRAKRCQQIMSDLPPERTRPAAPFEYTTMDMFGPYEVKDEVKGRVRLKVWGIVYSCMVSRAIHTDIVSDQSSQGFLLAYKRFTALRGHPRRVWSDPGTNFVGAKPALDELYEFLDHLEKCDVEEEATKHGTEWIWKIHPADSAHRNGAAEAAVRIVKRALHNLGGDGVFTWGEFQTFIYMAANLANERPIDARTQSREDCVEYISPNSLLLGRAGPKGDLGDFDFANYPYKRLRIIQEEVNKFWKKWCQLAGPNLFVRNKWHTTKRNVAVGDVVWLADQNALRGQYKLGRVVSVNADKKGIVRDVKVKTFPSYPVPIRKPSQKESERKNSESKKKLTDKIPATVLHRDVRRLVILIPIEEQQTH